MPGENNIEGTWSRSVDTITNDDNEYTFTRTYSFEEGNFTHSIEYAGDIPDWAEDSGEYAIEAGLLDFSLTEEGETSGIINTIAIVDNFLYFDAIVRTEGGGSDADGSWTSSNIEYSIIDGVRCEEGKTLSIQITGTSLTAN